MKLSVIRTIISCFVIKDNVNDKLLSTFSKLVFMSVLFLVVWLGFVVVWLINIL